MGFPATAAEVGRIFLPRSPLPALFYLSVSLFFIFLFLFLSFRRPFLSLSLSLSLSSFPLFPLSVGERMIIGFRNGARDARLYFWILVAKPRYL
jgi:hypothetical protein